MTRINRSALLAYPVQRMYELVNDVAMYPQYLDNCVGAEVLSHNDSIMVARLDLASKGFRYSLTTRNVLTDDRHIKMQFVDGPCKQFSGEWQFVSLNENACKVSLALEFELTNTAVNTVAKVLFSKLSDNLIDALSRRAKEIYG